MPHIPFRRAVLMAGVLFASHGATFAQPTAYPTRPVTLVVGSAAGGSNDVFARAIGKRLQDALGQPFVVDNKPAGGGVIANSTVARAPADGYTLAVVSSTFTTGAAIRPNLSYDAVKDFKPVALLAKGPLLVTVNKDTPYKTIQELVAAAKASPGKLNYGSSGAGSINQFATELFADASGSHFLHVPYKGMGPATNDLLGGQIQMLVASAPSIMPQVRAGRVRALAVTTAGRSPVAPDLPSLEEAGYRGSAVDLWWGVLAPANTPQPIVDKLNAEINRQIQSEDMRSFFLKEGAEPAVMNPAEFAGFIAAEVSRWKDVAKKADIKAD
ncbi:Bug family tripartite tricarboxylate transporter substrate binding protein [Xylophilus sp. ASV27]|uniref:Bug family tripartite tricarboxylate transporter substrate binding protein n=1 Tax=Xylophilus sp. ASV27 TaxID=2795129 RepID=UPI0018EBE72B|nr:tripartite tricarboxylate transporter substrate binding protein [Xylophilus sp. ASV27]